MLTYVEMEPSVRLIGMETCQDIVYREIAVCCELHLPRNMFGPRLNSIKIQVVVSEIATHTADLSFMHI